MFASCVLPHAEDPRLPPRPRDTERGRERMGTTPDTITGSPSESTVLTLAPHVNAYANDIEEVLISQADIQGKLAEVGGRISEDYQGRDLLLVGVLKGAFVVMADLSRYIRLPLEFDFMAVSSYGAATQTSGVVRILKDLDHEIEGRNVLIVEDIIDSGLTLNYLLKNLRTRRPRSLEVCALLQKSEVQQVKLDIKYRGSEYPPVFVADSGPD